MLEIGGKDARLQAAQVRAAAKLVGGWSGYCGTW